MKRIVLAAAASALAVVAAAPASAVTYVRDLGNVTVPPDAFFSPSIQVSAGSVDAYYTFTLTTAFTGTLNSALNGASFTSTNPGAVTFNSVGVYAGTATSTSTGAPTGTPRAFDSSQVSDASGNSIGYAPVSLAAGSYTIYLSGTAGSSNVIGSSIRFASQTAAIPEPASWGIMLLGFGMIGAGVRARRRSPSFATA